MKRIELLLTKNILSILILIILAVPALIPLTKPGFFPSQDEIFVSRIYEMDKSLKDGQFPVRWVSDFRYGEPLFNFYAPLPYYLGSLIHTFNFNFVDTSKILLALGFILSGVAIFFLSREYFGPIGGLISAALYIYAPYHSVDVYVRGALSESFVLILFPLIFFLCVKLSQKLSAKRMVLLSLSLAALFLTHNIMIVLFPPFLLGWMGFLVWQNKNLKLGKYFILSIILGLGMTASFLLPAFFERKFVQTEGLINGYYDYRAHFVALRQFISTYWGYGASVWGLEDELSFQVGYAHLIILGLSSAIVFWYRKNSKIFSLFGFLVLAFLFSLFMQHNSSTPIWTRFQILAFTQFPWRFLGVSIFFISFAGGVLGFFLKKNYILIAFLIIIFVIVANIAYFQPKVSRPQDTDATFINLPAMSSGDNLPRDYLSIWTKSIVSEKVIEPRALEGKIEINNFSKRTSSAKFQLTALTDTDIEVPITYFPGWKVYANDREIQQENATDLGLIRFKIPKGNYLIDIKLTDTPVRLMGNVISLLSFMLIILICIKGRFRLNKFL